MSRNLSVRDFMGVCRNEAQAMRLAGPVWRGMAGLARRPLLVAGAVAGAAAVDAFAWLAAVTPAPLAPSLSVGFATLGGCALGGTLGGIVYGVPVTAGGRALVRLFERVPLPLQSEILRAAREVVWMQIPMTAVLGAVMGGQTMFALTLENHGVEFSPPASASARTQPAPDFRPPTLRAQIKPPAP